MITPTGQAPGVAITTVGTVAGWTIQMLGLGMGISAINSIAKGSSSGSTSDKSNNSGSTGSRLTPQQMNQYKSDVLSGKDIKFKTKQDALDFIQKKFPNFSQEVAGSRSAEGWHFDSHSINGSSGDIDHINIYSKSQGFRVHITWGD